MTFVKPFTYFFEAAYTRVRVCVCVGVLWFIKRKFFENTWRIYAALIFCTISIYYLYSQAKFIWLKSVIKFSIRSIHFYIRKSCVSQALIIICILLSILQFFFPYFKGFDVQKKSMVWSIVIVMTSHYFTHSNKMREW